ncbi:FecR family protein [Dysgonomonas sp. BGC7]|uniref:FecR family protein n=1 Tax=Dysgonomonas sp. BGC7 TaxID=1658008 RepID=UPI000683478E|nr:FecR domain-containing protein [Dysgonomonas sp. BGC7]MBD8390432.1 DUF4974 domain-containing protein [Dysgonomonas sp. BGC7]
MEINPFKFASLLFSYLRKEDIGEKKQKEIEDIMNRSSEIKALHDELCDKEKISIQLSIINSFDTQSAYEKVTRPARLRRRFTLALRVASIVAILAIAIPLIYIQTKGSKYNADLIGSGKTILKTSDGNIVSLDTISSIAYLNDLSVRKEKGILMITEYEKSAKKRSNGNNIIEVPYKGTYKVILPDGTKVSLNSGSILEFPDHFLTNERVVKLKGEAFFDVVKADGKPFIVNTNNMSIRVLGTKFNVKSYDNESSSYATLLEGKIELSTDKERKSIQPGEQVVLNKETEALDIKEIDTEPIIAWIDDMFYFDRTPLEDVMRSLSRWYGVDIRYADDDPNVKKIVYSGKVRMYTHPEDILRKFEKTGGVKFELTDNTITISKR